MKIMRTATLAIVMLVAAASDSFSQSFFNGTKLLQSCSTESTDTAGLLDTGLCIGYVAAIRDASQCGITVNGFSSSTPTGAKLPQLVKVVAKWLNDHPEKLHLGAESLVAWALQDAFPCS